MSIFKKKKLWLMSLLLVINSTLFTGTAYADESSTLSVKEVWLTGDTLHISVAEKDSGEEKKLELNLRDYAKPADEYVTVQAADNDGNTSNAISFKNPYYEVGTAETEATEKVTESAISDNTDNSKPFTPDGTGTVIDNVTEENGKEFFTVDTPDGNVFYLIVDRQRDSENVYLLNAVDEKDLSSLAKKDDKTEEETSISVIPEPTPEPTPVPVEPEPEPAKSGNGTFAFIAVAALAVGSAAYYFKIVRPKKNGEAEPEYEQDDDFDEDDELEMEDDYEEKRFKKYDVDSILEDEV